MLWNNGILLKDFKYILSILSKYFQNELLAPYLHLNKVFIYFQWITPYIFLHIVCNKMEMASLGLNVLIMAHGHVHHTLEMT